MPVNFPAKAKRIAATLGTVLLLSSGFGACDNSAPATTSPAQPAPKESADGEAANGEAPAPAPVANECDGHKPGETWKVDCNSCQCSEDGKAACTLMACLPESTPPPKP